MAFKEIPCAKWEDFVKELEKLKKQQEFLGHTPKFLYRGQSDCSWTLETTLERYINNKEKKYLLYPNQYFNLAFSIKPFLETMLNKKWDINKEKYEKFLGTYHMDRFISKIFPSKKYAGDIYSYYIYLRHHGFPSPLLDWTRSPYIAAYFAFSDANPDDAKPNTDVSIYVYQEWVESSKDVNGQNDTYLRGEGHYVTTHPRHYHQQSDYTTCVTPVNEQGQLQFTNQQEYCEKNEKKRDYLWKFNIPSSERSKVLAYLDQHNINDFTLFGSPESLMKTMAYREIDLRQNP
jgi:hypothetical protein